MPDFSVYAVGCIGLWWCNHLLLTLNPGSYRLISRLSTNLSSLPSPFNEFLVKLSDLVRCIHRSRKPINLYFPRIDGLIDCFQLATTTFIKINELRITADCFEDAFRFLRNCVQCAC